MSFEPLPQNLEQGVNRFAQQQHVSHDEAVLILIETGLRHAPLPESLNEDNAVGPRLEVTANGRGAPLRKIAEDVRPTRGPQPPLRTDNPESIIGLFADSPEIVDYILEEVESRSERYSS